VKISSRHGENLWLRKKLAKQRHGIGRAIRWSAAARQSTAVERATRLYMLRFVINQEEIVMSRIGTQNDRVLLYDRKRENWRRPTVALCFVIFVFIALGFYVRDWERKEILALWEQFPLGTAILILCGFALFAGGIFWTCKKPDRTPDRIYGMRNGLLFIRDSVEELIPYADIDIDVIHVSMYATGDIVTLPFRKPDKFLDVFICFSTDSKAFFEDFCASVYQSSGIIRAAVDKIKKKTEKKRKLRKKWLVFSITFSVIFLIIVKIM
jgi:hypothetical protein